MALESAMDTFRSTKNKEYSRLILLAAKEIEKAANKGYYRVNIYTEMEDVDSDVRLALKSYLEYLGYKIDTTACFTIKWYNYDNS